MTETEAESYVREHWPDCHYWLDSYDDGKKTYAKIDSGNRVIAAVQGGTEKAAWQAAAEFTWQREEEIRQVEEEIKALTKNSYAGCEDYHQVLEGARDIVPRVRHHHALSRILARERAHLTELKRGMKETSHD
jgi:uncharacterized protein YjbK